ncbi:MAG: GNAT family N-acetyltransferase [Methanobacteriaceae archaeon]
MELVRFNKDKHDINEFAHLMAATDFETVNHYFPNESYIKVFSALVLSDFSDNEEFYVFEATCSMESNINNSVKPIIALTRLETKEPKISLNKFSNKFSNNFSKFFSILKIAGFTNTLKFFYMNYQFSRILAEIQEEDMHLAELSVSSNQRGKGIGPIMLNKVIDLARKRGFKRLTLDVESNNSHAKHVYEKFGFNIFAKDSIKWRGKKKEMYHMEYIL